MNRQDLIEMVQVATERKWERYGNINSVFTWVLQDFCKRNRFWWRKLLLQFQTVAGQGTYDLTAAGVILNMNVSEITIEETPSVVLIPNTSPLDPTLLPPIFDDQAQVGMILNSTPQAPSRYFLGYNDDHTLVFDPADAVYNVWVTAWAMPNPANDTTSSSIPLVPVHHHNTLMSGMEAYIWERTYGSSNPKYVLAKKDYEDGIMLAQSRPRFTTNYAQQLVQSEDAIRST